MTPYRVVPIAESVVRTVRATRKSPTYGHDARAETAAGYGPCRSCLRQFRVGEERRILFTYDAFADVDSYPSPGPVFVHEESCRPFDGAGFPSELTSLPLMLEGYSTGRWPVAREAVADGGVEGAVARLLAEPAVEYIHVRNHEAGCYIARIERVAAAEEVE